MKVKFILNGQPHLAETQPGEHLLDYLRNITYTGVKHGCDHGECGACGVLISGRQQNACLTLVHSLEGKQVETIESLATLGEPDAIQRSFIDGGAIQCGFCTPGMILSITALLREHPQPDEDQVRDALVGNLCRCTGYVKPVQAVLQLISLTTGQVVAKETMNRDIP